MKNTHNNFTIRMLGDKQVKKTRPGITDGNFKHSLTQAHNAALQILQKQRAEKGSRDNSAGTACQVFPFTNVTSSILIWGRLWNDYCYRKLALETASVVGKYCLLISSMYKWSINTDLLLCQYCPLA